MNFRTILKAEAAKVGNKLGPMLVKHLHSNSTSGFSPPQNANIVIVTITEN